MKRLAAAFCFCFLAANAQAERLVVSLSNERVYITSSFTGENLVLFGTIEPDAAATRLRSGYDLVVTATGPMEEFRARKKSRVLGIWVNTQTRRITRAPAYDTILSNRPLGDITTAEHRERLRIGLDALPLQQQVGRRAGEMPKDDPFRAAFLRLQNEYGLYREDPAAVTFLTPTVFRASIPLPSQVPTGTYTIDVKLFTEGALVGGAQAPLSIIKAGFEQYVAEAARDHGLLYGLVMALLALGTGWIASVVFRRD
jgi:uncharacterized protein (TIGR02186 family)